MRIRTILALTDLEEDSLVGLRTAYALAARKGAKLVVGHVLVPRTLDRSDVKEFLEEHRLDPNAATINIEVDADVLTGIDLLVEQTVPDLLVLSSHRKRGITRLLAASVPVGLAGRTTAPVLAMHADRDQEHFRKALVCVDGTEQSQELVDAASRLLDEGGSITALMVIEDSPLVIGGIDIGLFNKEVLEKADEAAVKFLRRLRLERSDLDLQTDHRVGNTLAEIRQAIEEHGADLVVVGLGGTGGATYFVMGRCAEQVVRHADIPVLVVPTERPET